MKNHKEEKIPGIGTVIHNFDEFHDYNFTKDKSIYNLQDFKKELDNMINSTSRNEFIFVAADIAIQNLSYEYACFLETIGINITLFNEHYQYGSFALEEFKNEHPDKKSILRFSKYFDNNFRLLTKKQDPFIKEKLNEQGFKNIYTTCQVVSYCVINQHGNYEWAAPIVFPDGMHCTTPLTSTDQYAQSCFEGIVAMSGKENEMIILRPNDNALRMRESAKVIAIPPIDAEVFLKSIEYVLKANKDFMPASDENYKIYLRPYIKGLAGGYGVGPATCYLFCIQIFPFGDFVGKKENSMNLISIEGKRRSHDGGIGSMKVSGNYAQTILDREKGKKGVFNEIYDDVFYFGESKKQIEINGQLITTTEDVLDEDAAGNLMFFKLNSDLKVTIYTPPLKRHSFLGGFTRDTILNIAKNCGYNIVEEEIYFKSITDFDGAFLTGSAVGLSKIKSMTYKNKKIEFYKDEKSNSIFNFLFDELYALRRGKINENIELSNLIFSFSV